MERNPIQYLLFPKWKLLKSHIDSLSVDNVKEKDKKEFAHVHTLLNVQLKKIRLLNVFILIVYVLTYFSFISVFLTISNLLEYLGTYIHAIVGFVGLPVLVVLLFLLSRMKENRLEDTRILIAKLIALQKKK